MLKKIVLFIIICFSIVSCETEFVPDVIPSDEIVVEGYIEAGKTNVLPPYVILTKNIPFFKELTAQQFANLYVKNAEVTITDGATTAVLRSICWKDLTLSEKKIIGGFVGVNADSVSKDFDLCIYADLAGTIKPIEGNKYDLTIKAEGKILTASTTIPKSVPLDSSIFIQPPGNTGDTLAQMRAWITDPQGPNYYKYFTRINIGSFRAGSNSVVDDRFFNGQSFKFNLFKSEPRNTTSKPENFGLFHIGDTISIKWCNIDKPHFEFWSTLEFNARNQGPFSSYTRIKSNINGGIGIWGGLNVSFLDKIVKK
jgi:Domain of unknown function (DUF4249)